MSNAKKFLIIVFTVMLVISLQFNTALTHKMNNGFSLTQLMENIFVPDAYASSGDWYACFYWEDSLRIGWWVGDEFSGYWMWICVEGYQGEFCI